MGLDLQVENASIYKVHLKYLPIVTCEVSEEKQGKIDALTSLLLGSETPDRKSFQLC